MTTLRLRELRLTAFKSYADAVLPIAPLTLLIGRNGSGKSNALDALEILSRLAKGEEVRDALEGNRGSVGSGVRGGAEGCAPYGQDTFTLGVTVSDDPVFERSEQWARLDVTIQVKPDVRVIAERLRAWLDHREVDVLQTLAADEHHSDLSASVYNGRRGRNPHRVFRSSHLLTSQLPLRLEGKTASERLLLEEVPRILSAMAGVFHLDPVPHLMRSYVPEQDSVLRRTGENLSAAIAALKRDDRDSFARLVSIVKELPEHEIRALEVGAGPFGDVMIALKEKRGRTWSVIPARQMSDGMLRTLAIATALLRGGRGLALDKSAPFGPTPPLCLVLEELENGLHPSQAARVLELVKQTSGDRDFQVVMTTHSPALLNALTGDDHSGVVVCDRDPKSGISSLTRLDRLPGYLRMMAQGRLGDAVTDGRVAEARHESAAPRASDIDALLGIG